MLCFAGIIHLLHEHSEASFLQQAHIPYMGTSYWSVSVLLLWFLHMQFTK